MNVFFSIMYPRFLTLGCAETVEDGDDAAGMAALLSKAALRARTAETTAAY